MACALPESVGHSRGQIVEIQMKNFMTYRKRVSFRPGPGFNVIIGPNGSGKSSIEIALVIGLGGDIETLKRQTNLREFVNRDAGDENAEILIRIADDKQPQPVEIVCQVSKAGDDQYTMNKKKVHRKYITNLAKAYGIETGNLCQFLAQDTVREFPELSPQMIFKDSLTAIGNTELQNDFNELKKLQVECNQLGETITHKANTLLTIVNDLKQLKQKREDLEFILGLKEKIDLHEIQTKYLEKGIVFKKMKMKRNKLEDLNECLENAKKNYENKQSALEMFNQEANQLVQSIKENQAQLQDFEHELRHPRPQQVEESIDQFEKMIKELQDEIVNENEKSKQLKDKIEQLERERDSLHVTVLKEQKSGLEEKKVVTDSKAQSLMDEIRATKTRRTEILCKVGGLRKSLEQKSKADNKKLELLKSRNADAYAGVMWLRNNKDNIRFNHPDKVYEPIMLNLNVDSDFAVQLENVIGAREMEAFVCEDPDDCNLLMLRLRDGQKLQKISVINARPNGFELKKPTWDQNLPGDIKRRFLNEAIRECPDAIFSHLCLKKRLHEIPVFVSDPPQKLTNGVIRRFFVGKTSQIAISSRYTNDVTMKIDDLSTNRLMYLCPTSEDNERQIEEIGAQIQKLEDSADLLQRQNEDLSREHAASIAQLETLQKSIKKIGADIFRHQDLEHKIRREKDILDGLSLLDKQSQIADLETKRLTLTERELPMANAEMQAKVSKVAELEIQIRKTEVILDQLQIQNSGERDALDKAKSEVEDLTNEKQELSNEISKLKEEYSQKIRNLPWIVEGPKVKPEDLIMPSELQVKVKQACGNNLDEVKAHLEVLKTQLSGFPQISNDVITRFDLLDKNRAKLQDEVEGLRLQHALMKGDLINNEKTLVMRINELVNKINGRFGQLMARLGYSGELVLDKGEGELDLKNYGLVIMVKFRPTENLQPLSGCFQSGGEKSVTTALFIMSLQELTNVPLRCVDEINQGMDEKNEMAVWNILFESAERNPSQFFYLAQKFPPKLKFESTMQIHFCFNGLEVKGSGRTPINVDAGDMLQKVIEKKLEQMESK